MMSIDILDKISIQLLQSRIVYLIFCIKVSLTQNIKRKMRRKRKNKIAISGKSYKNCFSEMQSIVNAANGLYFL